MSTQFTECKPHNFLNMRRCLPLVSVIAIVLSPNVLTTVSSQGLRGSIKTHHDHFSNRDLTINSPISLELLSFTEEAQLEAD